MQLARSSVLSGLLLRLFGVLVPGLVWALAQLVPGRAAGRAVGLRCVGQRFRQPGYFHGRPSAVGYNAASNLSASSPAAARARRLPPAQVAALVRQHTAGPWLGFAGPARVNVLALKWRSTAWPGGARPARTPESCGRGW